MQTKELIEKLLADVRGNAIEHVYSGLHGSHVKTRCDLCGEEWKPNAPEAHDSECLIFITTVALERL